MTGFTKTFLAVFLSWLKQVFNSILFLFNDEKTFSLFNIIEKHWIIIAVVLTLIGVIIDWMIHIIRWKPYYVWFGKKNKKI